MNRFKRKFAIMAFLAFTILFSLISMPIYAEGKATQSQEISTVKDRHISLNYDGTSVVVQFFNTNISAGLTELSIEGLPKTVDLSSVELVTQDSGVRILDKAIFENDSIMLVCNVESESSKSVTFRLTYSMTGIIWSINYTAIISETGNNLDLIGSLVLFNGTSADLSASRFDIISNDSGFPGKLLDHPIASLLGMKSYEIKNPIDLTAYSSAVVELCRMTALSVNIEYYVNHSVDPVYESVMGTKTTLPVNLSLVLTKTKSSDVILEGNLPGGDLKVFVSGKNGELYLISSGKMGNISADLKNLSIDMGVVPDLYVDILCTDKKKIGTSSWEEAYQVVFNNKISSDVEIRLSKYFRTGWSILQSTAGTWSKTDDGNANLVVKVNKSSTQDILFRVRYTE